MPRISEGNGISQKKQELKAYSSKLTAHNPKLMTNNTFKITDERFSAEYTERYDLTLEVQYSRLRFTVKYGDELLVLEDHFLGQGHDLTACLSRCTALIEHHPFLGHPSWKSVQLLSDFEIHTLVPAPFYRPSLADSYLALAYPSASVKDFDMYSGAVSDHYLVSGTPKKVTRLFTTLYPGLGTPSSLAIQAGYFAQKYTHLTMGMVSDHFVTLYTMKGKNKFLNIEKIPIRNLPGLPASASELVLFGEITPFSASYRVMEEKFQTVRIGHTPPPSGHTDSTPWHRYFTLLTCGLSEIKIPDQSRIAL